MPWTWGVHAVETVLREAPDQVMELWLVQSRRPGEARTRVRSVAEQAGVRFRLVTDAQLRAAVGDVAHQGVAARVSDFEYADEDTLLALEGPCLLVALDEVQDPHNLGAIIRTACGLGASGVVIPRHRSASVTPAVRKVSAGATSRLPVARVTNLSRFLAQARDRGFWVYGAVVDGGERVPGVALADRAVLVVGSEGAGLRRGVREQCDVVVTLPSGGVESLNVSVAAALLIWEWARARVG